MKIHVLLYQQILLIEIFTQECDTCKLTRMQQNVSISNSISGIDLTDKINNDIKEAMKAREQDKLAALRDIKSKLLLIGSERFIREFL